MRIAIGCDHAGLALKAEIVGALESWGHDVADVGTHTGDSVDYPDFAHQVAGRVARGEVALGVLVCGTGQGMAMSANRHEGVRAAVVGDVFSAGMTRRHNDCNVLCLGARVTGGGLALQCVEAWLSAEFEGGRHARRVGKIQG